MIFDNGKGRFVSGPIARLQNWFMALLLHRHLSSRESGKTTHSKIIRVESHAVTFSGGAKWKKFTTSVAGLMFTKN